MQGKVRTIGTLVLLFSFLLPSTRPAQASHTTGFNKNLVVFDEQFTDWQSMSVAAIQDFLNSKPGVLKTYSVNGKSAAQIIYDAAVTSRISPKVILTTLQKEQSALTDPGAESRLYKAMGYGCPDSGSCSAQYFGFDNQVREGTAAFRKYLDRIADHGHTNSGPGPWGPGIASNIPCISSDYNNGRELCIPGTTITITPANASTAALYTYTPHPGGNFAFWFYWRQYSFDLGRIYPEGTLLRASGSPHVWLIQNGKKRRFANSAAFLSRYTFNRVITVPSDHLFVYENGPDISYANYSLLGAPNGGIYLLVDDTKRPITSRAAFQNAGYRREEVTKVTWATLDQFPDGQAITTENVYPSGVLMQDKTVGTIFYVKDGTRYPIPCREIYRSQFGKRRAVPTDPAKLATYPMGSEVGFKDGDLVTAGGTAYVISNGQKLPIASPEAFAAYRFNWANLQFVSASCLRVHPDGRLLDVTPTVILASQ